jgi:phosphohistidine phosphatase
VSTHRRLVLMRHARAEPFATTDHARTLTDRGRRDATQAGLHLARTGVVPDYVVVSSASRTVATWEAVAVGSRAAAEVVVEDAVYSGDTDAVLETLQRAPLDAGVVAFVGHNPTVAQTAHVLDDGNGEPTAVRAMLQGYPTGAMAVLEVDVPWCDLAAEAGRLVDFYVGRG